MKNLSLFFAMLIVNVIVLFIWSPIIGAIKGTVLDAFILSADKASVILDYTLYGNDSIFVQQVVAFDNLALLDTPALPSFFRVALSLVFVGSFLLKPLVIRPVNLLWRRIVESDKPVFTLVFGGAAAFASALGEAAKHL